MVRVKAEDGILSLQEGIKAIRNGWAGKDKRRLAMRGCVYVLSAREKTR